MEQQISIAGQFSPDINIQNREAFLKSFDVKPHKVEKVQGYDTMPISALEKTLDETYLGLWKTDTFSYQVIANEIVGTILLHVYDPTVKTWITRIGCASVMIRQTSGAQITDISAKIKNGLVMDFPKLSTMCLKAAAKTLGKKFGRDLNRKFEDGYDTVYSDEIELGNVIADLKAKIDCCHTAAELLAVWNENETLHTNTAAKRLFNSAKMKIALNGSK